jgi:hypothetical protein
VISVSKLVKKYDGSEEIAEILKTLAKYGGEGEKEMRSIVAIIIWVVVLKDGLA